MKERDIKDGSEMAEHMDETFGICDKYKYVE